MSKKPRIQVIRLTTDDPHHIVSVEVVPSWSKGLTHEPIAIFRVGNEINYERAKRPFTTEEMNAVEKAEKLAELLCEADVPPIKVG